MFHDTFFLDSFNIITCFNYLIEQAFPKACRGQFLVKKNKSRREDYKHVGILSKEKHAYVREMWMEKLRQMLRCTFVDLIYSVTDVRVDIMFKATFNLDGLTAGMMKGVVILQKCFETVVTGQRCAVPNMFRTPSTMVVFLFFHALHNVDFSIQNIAFHAKQTRSLQPGLVLSFKRRSRHPVYHSTRIRIFLFPLMFCSPCSSI